VDRAGDFHTQFSGTGDPFEIHARQQRSPAETFGNRQDAESPDNKGLKGHW
jgi:hypothetical protein